MEKQRICCVCRKKHPTAFLLRIAREKQNDGYKYFVDFQGNANGRGCYLCPLCIEKAIKTKALNRSFKCNVDSAIYTELARLHAPQILG
jgi:predicted RNA-binding protein YlxR (DUF448 family)